MDNVEKIDIKFENEPKVGIVMDFECVRFRDRKIIDWLFAVALKYAEKAGTVRI